MNLKELLERLQALDPHHASGGEGSPASEKPKFGVPLPEGLKFDDDPVGGQIDGLEAEATPADLNTLLARFTTLTDEGEAEALKQIAAEIRKADPLPPGCFLTLVRLAASFLPVWPQLPAEDPPETLGDFLGSLWETASGADLRYQAGEPLWQWHEFNHDHQSAREILDRMADLANDSGRTGELPGLINNHAFQLMEEKRWQEAADGFLKAATLADESGSKVEAANSWLNHWCCRYETEGSAIEEDLRRELPRHGEVVGSSGWVASRRKALVYLARLDADSGHRDRARKLVEFALRLDRRGAQFYLTRDEELAEQLRD